MSHRRRRMLLGWLVAAGVGAFVGCRPTAFVCQSDADCDGDDQVCEDTNFCSVAADECESGRKYTDLSGALSGQCVAVGDDTGGATGTFDGTTAAPGGDDASEAGGTTLALDDGDSSTGAASSSGPEGSSGGAESTGTAETTGTTGGGPIIPGPCNGSLISLEAFDVVGLAAPDWELTIVNDATVEAVDGALQLAVGTPVVEQDWWAATSLNPVPWPVSVAVEVVQAPEAPSTSSVGISIGDPAHDYNLIVVGEQLVLRSFVFDWVTLAEVPHDPVAHRWLRLSIVGEPVELVAETSTDGEQWAMFHAESDPGLFAEDVFVGINGGMPAANATEPPGLYAIVDNLAICE